MRQDILSPAASFLVENVEFYHDQGGVTPGRAALGETVKRNILRESDLRTRSRNATGLLHESCGPSTSDDAVQALNAGHRVLRLRTTNTINTIPTLSRIPVPGSGIAAGGGSTMLNGNPPPPLA